MERNHREEHYVARVGWLRAAVLGANDGIVSTASLIVGVAAASGKTEVLIAGMAGMVAGALSMAAGEYVSVSSQADTEKADITREAAEIAADPEEERRALADIYERRGLPPPCTPRTRWGPMSAKNWGFPNTPRQSRWRRRGPRP